MALDKRPASQRPAACLGICSTVPTLTTHLYQRASEDMKEGLFSPLQWALVALSVDLTITGNPNVTLSSQCVCGCLQRVNIYVKLPQNNAMCLDTIELL